MDFPVFEVIYEVKATCVVRVHALTAESAENMVRLGEAGDIAEDNVGFERKIVGVNEIAPKDH